MTLLGLRFVRHQPPAGRARRETAPVVMFPHFLQEFLLQPIFSFGVEMLSDSCFSTVFLFNPLQTQQHHTEQGKTSGIVLASTLFPSGTRT